MTCSLVSRNRYTPGSSGTARRRRLISSSVVAATSRIVGIACYTPGHEQPAREPAVPALPGRGPADLAFDHRPAHSEHRPEAAQRAGHGQPGHRNPFLSRAHHPVRRRIDPGHRRRRHRPQPDPGDRRGGQDRGDDRHRPGGRQPRAGGGDRSHRHRAHLLPGLHRSRRLGHPPLAVEQQPPPPPAPGYPGYGAVSPPTDGMAIASLILGIVAFPGICCYGVLGVAFGATALILGRISVRKIRASNGMIGGYGLAQAGWICGLVAAILGAIYGIFNIALIILGVSGAFNNLPFITPTPSG